MLASQNNRVRSLKGLRKLIKAMVLQAEARPEVKAIAVERLVVVAVADVGAEPAVVVLAVMRYAAHIMLLSRGY